MCETILAPVDGSERSAEALEHAIDVAKRYDATMHVQYVVESSPAFSNDLAEADEASSYGSLEEAGVDVVVMATADRTGVSRKRLGSATERIVRSCPVPVLTVNASDDA